MKKSFTIFIILFFFGAAAKAQYSRYTVRFTDKNGTPYTLNNPAAYLSAQSIQRRTNQSIGLDSTDLPITPAYIDSIRSIAGVTVLNQSKWFNQVLVKITDSTVLPRISSFSFVKKISPVATATRRSYRDSVFIQKDNIVKPLRNTVNRVNGENNIASPDSSYNGNYFYYGNNYAQIHIHEGEYLHNQGFHGEGITIAILDAGFYNYLNNPAFDSVRQNNQVLGSWDYVNGKQSVNEENDHGAFCFSIMAANEPGQIIGSAPKAKYWLFKTEDVTSEYPVEEQNWAAAAEFADSAGADLISTSLGYAYFDDSSFNLDYADRNGHTSLVTMAANLAVAKGMIVTASAGNSGTETGEPKYVICPADGDSVLAVGATDTSGNIAAFSSWGPNSSGGVKPNIVSVGLGTVLAWYDGTVTTGDGTSFSNPNLAGLIACLWQAFPGSGNHDIIDAVQKSSNRYANPDDRYGYGIPDFKIAYGLLYQKTNLQSYIMALGNQWIKVYPVPFTNNFTVLFKAPADGNTSLELTDAAGRIIERKNVPISAGDYYTVHFDDAVLLARGAYFVNYNDGKTKTTIPVVKQ